MVIQIYGTGCTSCKQLFELTTEVAARLIPQAEVQYITDLSQIVSQGILQTPALVIEGEVIHVGRADEAQIRSLLEAYLP